MNITEIAKDLNDTYKTEREKNLEKKILEKLNDEKVRIECDDREEAYNYAIEVCACYVEDMFKELLIKLGG